MKIISLPHSVSRYGLLVIVLLAFAIRFVFFLSLQPWENNVVNDIVITWDAIEYHQQALSIVQKKSFEDVSPMRTPGYPMFVAVLYRISSYKTWFVLFSQVLLGLVSMIIVFKLANMVFSQSVALFSAFLFAIDTTQIVSTVELYTEAFFLILFLISILCLYKGLKENKILMITLSALFLGFTTLTRPITYMFPFISILLILLLSYSAIKVRVIQSLVFLVVFCLTISPWVVYNYSNHGAAKLSSIGGINLLYYNATYAEVLKTGKNAKDVRDKFTEITLGKGLDTINWNSFGNSEIYSEVATEYIKNNLITYMKVHLYGIIHMYRDIGMERIKSVLRLEATSPNTYLNNKSFNATSASLPPTKKSNADRILGLSLEIYLLINYVFCIYGIIAMICNKEKVLILFILVILYFSILTGPVGYNRYRIPVMPFINILCAFGIYRFSKNNWFSSVNKPLKTLIQKRSIPFNFRSFSNNAR